MQHHASHVQRIFKEKEIQSEIQIAYLKFIQSVPRRPADRPFLWKSTPHHCTEECDFFTHRNVLICKATANWHYCTEETCDRLIRTSDSRVCQLTGASYSLLLEMDPTGDYHGNEDHDNDEAMAAPACDDYGETECAADRPTQTPAAQAPRRRKKKPGSVAPQDLTGLRVEELQFLEAQEESRAREEEEEEEAQAEQPSEEIRWEASQQLESSTPMDDSSPQDSQQAATEPTLDTENHFARIATFESLLRRIFPLHTSTHMNLLRSIASNAARLWMLIQFSDEFRKSTQRYAMEYHLLVVVYYMCAGYAPLQCSVVPYNAWIREHIPQVRDLKRITVSRGTIKVPNFTQASKLFKSCFLDLVQHQLPSVRDRLCWTA
jgi:hypothetical protein